MLTDVDIYHAVAGLQDLRSLSVQSVTDPARPQEQVSNRCAATDDFACKCPLQSQIMSLCCHCLCLYSSFLHSYLQAPINTHQVLGGSTHAACNLAKQCLHVHSSMVS